jgi:2,4-dienoyl-CoA reductase-like NADH-dependent reductase (Old Yellow Enzyme family)
VADADTLSRELLFQPLTIRNMTVPNRIVMSPMTRGFSPDGVPGEDVAAYYRRRAEGETGLIITEAVAVDHPVSSGDAGLDERDVPFLVGDKVLAGWRKVVEQAHEAGAKIIPQLWHQGAMRIPGTGPFPDLPSASPSGIWGPAGRMTSIMDRAIPADVHIGEPLTEAEIEAIIDAFVRCAVNAIEVGFDGIALHGGHGYLIDQFIWEETNQRTDQWGGSRAKRMRFPTEIVRRIRAAIGEDYPIFFRFSQWKLQDFKGSIAANPEELAEVLLPLAEAGIDVFDGSIRYFASPAFEGSDLNLAGWAKTITGKLAMTVGGVGINRGKYDTKALSAVSDNTDLLLPRIAAGEFDLVAVGRAMMGDPHWAAKVRKGEPFRAYDASTDDHVLT